MLVGVAVEVVGVRAEQRAAKGFRLIHADNLPPGL